MRFSFLKKKTNDSERFHRNLFLDELDSNDDGFYSDYEYEYPSDEDSYQNFKFNTLSLPLTDTIAEYVQGFSKDKFFLNDLSFLFEMSRKRAISPYAIIVALLYLKRLKTKTSNTNFGNKCSYWPCYSAKNLIESYFNPLKNEFENFGNTEFCLVSILLASKFLIDEGEDDEIYNDQWAEAADIPVEKINKLEKIFLNKMEWEMFVSGEEFWKFTHDLTEKATRKKIKLQLDNCTYSDLEALLSFSKQFSFVSIYKSLALLTKIFFVCSSTLLYVTLSTYLVTNGIMSIKSQLSNSTYNFLSMDKLWTQNHTFDFKDKKIVIRDFSNIAIEINYINCKDSQIKRAKFCHKRMNHSIERVNWFKDELKGDFRKEISIFNQVSGHTFRLL